MPYVRVLWLLLGAAVAASCGPDPLPPAAYSHDNACLELRFDGAVQEGGRVRLGTLIARVAGDADCGDLAELRCVLYADEDGDGKLSDGEAVFEALEPPQTHLRAKNVNARTITMPAASADLRFVVSVTTTTGKSAWLEGPTVHGRIDR